MDSEIEHSTQKKIQFAGLNPTLPKQREPAWARASECFICNSNPWSLSPTRCPFPLCIYVWQSKKTDSRKRAGRVRKRVTVTRSFLCLPIPMALRFNKSNLAATDMTQSCVLSQQIPPQLNGGTHQEETVVFLRTDDKRSTKSMDNFTSVSPTPPLFWSTSKSSHWVFKKNKIMIMLFLAYKTCVVFRDIVSAERQ